MVSQEFGFTESIHVKGIIQYCVGAFIIYVTNGLDSSHNILELAAFGDKNLKSITVVGNITDNIDIIRGD